MKTENTVKEHILVCLSSSPSNPKVIKTASQMAKVFNADFTALFIETSRIKKMTEDNRRRLEKNTAFAKENGAKIVTVDGDDIAFQVSQYAKTGGITKIVIGRSGYKPNRLFAPPNFVDRLIQMTPDTEIYVIPDKIQKIYIGQKQAGRDEKRLLPELTFKDTFNSLIIIAAATIIGKILYLFNINESNIVLVYILGVLLTAYVTEHKIYSLVSAILTVLVFNFCFAYPYYTFTVNTSDYHLTFLIMFLVALFASSITQRVKEHSKRASLKAYSTEVMLEMSQKLQQAQNSDEITKTTLEQINKLLDCEVFLFHAGQAGLDLSACSDISENDKKIIKWIYENNKQSIPDNFAKSKYLYLPVSNLNTVFAVVAVLKENISEFERNLLIAMLRESALAYEKEMITQTKNELVMKNKQEELRSTLLRAISHDLRTPLTSISGFADILLKNSQMIAEDKKLQIYSNIYDDSIWLLNLVENLLSITRFDRNEIKIKKESEYLLDVITDALSHLGRKKENFKVNVDVEDEALSAKMDGRLIAQVIFNLVDNAMKYSPSGTNITVSAKARGENIEVSVADEGNGISDEDKNRIFEMFYTVKNSVTDGRRGLGLGLALCKAVVNAHGGEISIKDNKPKGTVFSFIIKGDFDKDCQLEKI